VRLSAVAALALLLLGCPTGNFGVTITQPPAVRQPPIPEAFSGDAAPALEATDWPGLFRAPRLGPNVWFHEPGDLWYRYAYHRWYQAFRWNGNWFIVAETPAVLVGREIERVALPELPELPTLPEVPEDDATALPELPEDDAPDEAFEPP